MSDREKWEDLVDWLRQWKVDPLEPPSGDDNIIRREDLDAILYADSVIQRVGDVEWMAEFFGHDGASRVSEWLLTGKVTKPFIKAKEG